MESETDAQHQVVGIFEALQAVADVEVDEPRHGHFQRERLVESALVVGSGKEVVAHTRIDGKKRHDVFRPDGCAQCPLPAG